jgi:hypothetical protein
LIEDFICVDLKARQEEGGMRRGKTKCEYKPWRLSVVRSIRGDDGDMMIKMVKKMYLARDRDRWLARVNMVVGL